MEHKLTYTRIECIKVRCCMRQKTCYLYEYHKNMQVKNIGYVKCLAKDNTINFEIHGKGILCKQGQNFEMNLFKVKDETNFISRAGHVESEFNRIKYQVKVENVDETLFDEYDGLCLEIGGVQRYVAMWNQKQVYFENVKFYTHMKDDETVDNVEMEMSLEKERIHEVENSDVYDAEIEKENLDVGESTIEIEEHEMLEMEEDGKVLTEEFECEVEDSNDDVACIEAEECCYDAIRRRKKTFDEPGVLDLVEREENRPVQTISRKKHSDITYEKIERNDIAKLPQREWRLANNSFLLHGYHNYSHILFIQEAGRSFIGVPGIYSHREADAAKNFGFPVFHRIDEIDWEMEEVEKGEDFGYWCKEVMYRGR